MSENPTLLNRMLARSVSKDVRFAGGRVDLSARRLRRLRVKAMRRAPKKS